MRPFAFTRVGSRCIKATHSKLTTCRSPFPNKNEIVVLSWSGEGSIEKAAGQNAAMDIPLSAVFGSPSVVASARLIDNCDGLCVFSLLVTKTQFITSTKSFWPLHVPVYNLCWQDGYEIILPSVRVPFLSCIWLLIEKTTLEGGVKFHHISQSTSRSCVFIPYYTLYSSTYS